MKQNKKRKKMKGQIILHIVFLLMSATYILPFLMVISVSFTDETALIRDGYSLIPPVFSTKAYQSVFKDLSQVLYSYGTTFLFTAVSTFLAVLIMGIMAYPLSRPNYKHNRFVSLFVLFTMLFSA